MFTSAHREAVTEMEVVSLDGRDTVTLIINGQVFDMPANAAKMLASDLNKGVKRAKGDGR